MELDFSQIAPKVNHPGFLQVAALSMHNLCLHTQSHAYWYKNVMHLSRLFRRLLFWKHSSRLVIWGCFSIVSNVIWYNYCCRRHTMHGNMVFSTHYILGTPQKSGGFLMCSVYVDPTSWSDVGSTSHLWLWINVTIMTLDQRHTLDVYPTNKSSPISTLIQRHGMTLDQRWSNVICPTGAMRQN